MKYKDRNTLISHSKHLDRTEDRNPWDLTDRERRRIRDKKHKKFISKFAGRIEKDWWECLSVDDKIKIHKEYETILVMSISAGTKPDIDKWVSMIKKDFKPDVQLYRECVINKVLK